MALEDEIKGSEGGWLHRRMERLRAFMGRHLILLMLYRSLVIGLGGICVILGIIMLVAPGPGWLFIFMGMGLWGTEFHWAHRLNVWAKAKVLATVRQMEARYKRRRRRKMDARWASRRARAGQPDCHYCPNGQHYH